MQKNEQLTLQIVGMTSEGQGVGRVEGFVVFIDGALLGETVLVHIVKRTSSYAIGRLLEILAPADTRREPFCPVFERCGGCTLQHMSYEATLAFKMGVVTDALQRIAGLDATDVARLVAPILGMDQPLHYRNKAQYPVGKDSTGEPIAGFYAKRSHAIVPHCQCAIQDETSGKVRRVVLDFMQRHPSALSAYDENTGRGLIRHIMTRVGFATGDVMVVLVTTAKAIPHHEELIADLAAAVPGLKSVFVNLNTARNNIILGERCFKLYGDDFIHDNIGSLTFCISPLSFFQVNPIQTERLYAKALEYAALTGRETVYDLYCGTGTIGLFAAQNAKQVIGVESVPAAIDDAHANAAANGIHNATFRVGLAEDVLDQLMRDAALAPAPASTPASTPASAPASDAVVILDPPRKGCEQRLLDALAQMAPSRIVYVSCNPATLARDLKFLLAQSYQLTAVQPVDMFPWGTHIECVVLMSKVEK